MIRSTMRTMLRRRLVDTDATEGSWTDAELNEILNEALHLVQKEVLKIVPDAFMYLDEAPLTAGNEFYPLPSGFWYELFVGIKASSTSTTFGKIERGIYDRDRELSANSTRKYDIRGRFITFMPIPDYSVNPGYQIQFVPTLSMSDDSLAPDLHQGLHLAVVLWAHLIALGETLENQDTTGNLLKQLLEDIPLFYHRGGEAQQLRLDAGQPIGPASFPWRSTVPGRDQR